MATVIEERVDTLEMLLGQFIVQTNLILTRMERDTQTLKQEMSTFKDEISTFKDEIHHDTHIFKNEVRRDTQMLKQEIQALKQEMSTFKDEIRQDTQVFKKELNQKWGDLANRLGTLVEDIVAPSIPGIAKTFFACEDFEFFAVRIKKRQPGNKAKRREFDVIAVCETKVIVNETKVEGRIDYINRFKEALNEWSDYFPEYQSKTLIPIFASLYYK